MAGRILATHVHVHREGKESVILEAGSVVPKWAEKLITNPAAFAEPVVEEPGEAAAEHGEYSTWTNRDLKAALVERELPVSGNHDELVQRLIDDDTEKAENGDDDESDEGLDDDADEADEDNQE